MILRRRVVVRGVVQGVGFRWSCVHEARGLGVHGWVCNRPDGSVELVAEGEAAAVRELVAWAQHGPTGADVWAVEVVDEEVEGVQGFRVTG